MLNMRRRYTFLLLIIVVCGMIYGCSSNKSTDNIFAHTIRVSDDSFSHTTLDFFMSSADVEKTVGKNRTLEFYNLSNEIVEQCNYEEDKLVSIQYQMTVSPDEKSRLCNTLYEQAKECMPEPMSDNLEDIKAAPEQTEVIWKDENNVYVRLQFAAIYDSDDQMITLSIHAPHPGFSS